MIADEQQKLKMGVLFKLATRIYGVNVVDPIKGVGETIKEDVEGLYKINDSSVAPPQQRANEIVFHKGITTKLVYNSQSHLSIRKFDEGYFLFSDYNLEPLTSIRFSKRPEHYNMETSQGTPMKNIGQAMGMDCLAIAVDKQCSYFKNGDFCRYCNISPTNLKSGIPRFSSLEDIAELIKASGNKFRFFDLTGGTFENTNEECKTYTKIGEVIKNNLAKKGKYGGPFSFTPPDDLNLLDKLYETDVDVISFNMDIWDLNVLKEICPGKSKIGRNHYTKALLYAKELWGRGNVVMQFLVADWESNESYLEGIKYYLDQGILVNITTFKPSPGSTLFKVGKSKSFIELTNLYISYGELIKEYGLFPNDRGSILTSHISNRSSIANETARGWLTRENFEYKDLEHLVRK